MPTVTLTDDELKAIYAVLRCQPHVNWIHYAQARQRLLEAGHRQAQTQEATV